MKRCAICSDNRGNFLPGRFGDPDSEWVCRTCRAQNASMGVTWGKASARECHSDRLDTSAFPARLADCMTTDEGRTLNELQRSIVRLLVVGRKPVLRRVQRRVGGRRIYVSIETTRAITHREIAGKLGCNYSYVSKIARLLKGAKAG